MALHLKNDTDSHDVSLGLLRLPRMLQMPQGAFSLVIFAQGSGPGRFGLRNQVVADAFGEKGMATLLFDLLRR